MKDCPNNQYKPCTDKCVICKGTKKVSHTWYLKFLLKDSYQFIDMHTLKPDNETVRIHLQYSIDIYALDNGVKVDWKFIETSSPKVSCEKGISTIKVN